MRAREPKVRNPGTMIELVSDKIPPRIKEHRGHAFLVTENAEQIMLIAPVDAAATCIS
jgi:hypothetical protein